MNDTERFQQISDFIKIAEKQGARYLFDALTIAKDIEDPEDKPSYTAIIAAHLARLGSLEDIDKARQLGRETRPIDRLEFALPAIIFHFLSESQPQKALDVLREMEVTATEFESLDYDYSIKATYWEDIGDLYKRMGIFEQARKMWQKAAKMAQMGQNNVDKPQDSVDSFKTLRALCLALLDVGYYEDAVAVANTINNNGYREDTLKKINKHKKRTE